MLLSQVLKSTGIDFVFPEIDITGIACDSRKVEQGFLFAALNGTKANGAEFITDACNKGATVILVQENTDLPTIPATVIPVSDVRLALAKIASNFYTPAPKTVVAVTGTNGKTSTANFTRQIWEILGHKAACIGTLGVITNEGTQYGSLTTPDSVTLHQELTDLANKDYHHVAIEASSHGIEQHRISGISFSALAFTNITQDHLDYHITMEKYLDAKLKLFDLPVSSNTVVLNADIAEYEKIKAYCENKGLNIIDYGLKAKTIALKENLRTINSQELHLEIKGKSYTVTLPLAGTFQAMNALCSLGLVIACGADIDKAVNALSQLKGADGRLDFVAERKNGSSIYVDYAHTPDALETVIKALRPHTKNKLHVVFGCGGDRDATKRPLMGAICNEFADVCYVTDDNPRTEDPILIRNAILQACPKGLNIGNRALAIKTAVKNLEAGDILVIAGKGHETGQLIQGVVHHFNDKEETLLAIQEADTPLWTAKEIHSNINAEIENDFDIFGISIDTRTLNKGDLYIALKGENMDGHKFVLDAIAKGASGVLVSEIPAGTPLDKVIKVDDTFKALNDMAKFARFRGFAKIIGITGSSGKTSTKEILKIALTSVGRTHTTLGNLNNNIGLPLTLARMPKNTDFAVIEMGINHIGEMTELTMLAQPDIAMITMVGAAHCEFFKTEEETAHAKAEIFKGMGNDTAVFLNADNTHFALLKKEAEKSKIKNIYSFGSTADDNIALLNVSDTTQGSVITVRIDSETYTYTLPLAGRHQVQNSLGVIGILKILGVDMPTALQSIAQIQTPKGRGERFEIKCVDGSYTLIDDAYNANPDSMRAAINVLGNLTPKNSGKRIAILGDMLELGEKAKELHVNLKQDIIDNDIDVLFTVGENFGALFDEMPPEIQGIKAMTALELLPMITNKFKADDIVLVKGSNGSKMSEIVNALKSL